MGKVATREAYGAALAQYGADERIIVLDADLSKSTKTSTFKQVYPERHFNMGIAEANMMCVAAGLATTGKIVFASTFAIFASERACEQIRKDVYKRQGPIEFEIPEITETPTPAPTSTPTLTKAPTKLPTKAPESTEIPTAAETEIPSKAPNPTVSPAPAETPRCV